MTRKILFLTVAVTALVFFIFSRGSEKVFVDDLAPYFTLPTHQGPQVSLESLRGRVVLLNFWATWCPPCLEEMPSLEDLNQKMMGKNFSVIAISVDEMGFKSIEPFLEKVPLTFQILNDGSGDVAELYGVHLLPETFLIDQEGKIIDHYQGPRDWKDEKIVSEILRYVEGS